MTNLELADKLQKESEHFSGAQDLVGMLWDAGAALRNLHTENTALRVTEDNLRQELQECQDQRRAAFRRIEELDAMRAQTWQGEPEVSTEHGPWVPSTIHDGETYCKRCLTRSVFAGNRACDPHVVYTHPAPQQIGQGEPDEQRMRNLLARYENQWHRMGELWERCQGKGWPEAESKEFARLRDELTPATRAMLLASSPPAPQAEQHPDDAAVDRFAAAMKDKLATARQKGRGGWETCSAEDLGRMLREHVEKGDPRDVANFCMFLWSLGYGIAPQASVMAAEAAHNIGEKK